MRIMLIVFASALLTGCRGPRSVRADLEWPRVVEQARLRVLDKLPNLDYVSREMIRTNDPRLIAIGDPFGTNYRFAWTVASNRVVELDADGDYRHVDDRPVKIRESVRERY